MKSRMSMLIHLLVLFTQTFLCSPLIHFHSPCTTTGGFALQQQQQQLLYMSLVPSTITSFLCNTNAETLESEYPRPFKGLRYAARVMYDGTRFRGWQDVADPRIRTIQNTISKAISKRFDTKITVTGASRTDRGVHAQGQTIHFNVPYEVCCRPMFLYLI